MHGRAEELEHDIVGELLIDNDSAVALQLAEENRRYPKWSVAWIEDGMASGEPSIELSPSFGWSYVYPLAVGTSHFGILRFDGNLFKLPEIASLLLLRVLFVALFCLMLVMTIRPLASRIPNEMILTPIRNLLVTLQGGAGALTATEAIPYRELQKINADFQRVLEEKARLEEERLEVQKEMAVARTAQMLAHDLRKPCSLLQMVLDALAKAKDHAAMRALVDGSLPGVLRALNHIESQVGALLQVGEESGLKIETANVREIVENSANDLRLSRLRSDVALSIDWAAPERAPVDQGGFLRVVGNLVINALQACPAGGKVWLSAKEVQRKDQRYMQLAVGNGGSFIPLEDRLKVFQLFYTKGKKNGSGFGLAIAQKVVRAHGGEIWCESDEAKGTEFVFTIPLPATVDLAPAKSGDPQRLRGVAPRVALVIDDDQFEADLIADALSGANESVTVVRCFDAESAIKAGKEHRPDVIICDIELGHPKLDGHDLVKTFRDQGSTALIHVHTNRRFHDDAKRAYSAGATSFAPKPFTAAMATNVLRHGLKAAVLR